MIAENVVRSMYSTTGVVAICLLLQPHSCFAILSLCYMCWCIESPSRCCDM